MERHSPLGGISPHKRVSSHSLYFQRAHGTRSTDAGSLHLDHNVFGASAIGSSAKREEEVQCRLTRLLQWTRRLRFCSKLRCRRRATEQGRSAKHTGRQDVENHYA